jgi:hypothetical protein
MVRVPAASASATQRRPEASNPPRQAGRQKRCALPPSVSACIELARWSCSTGLSAGENRGELPEQPSAAPPVRRETVRRATIDHGTPHSA